MHYHTHVADTSIAKIGGIDWQYRNQCFICGYLERMKCELLCWSSSGFLHRHWSVWNVTIYYSLNRRSMDQLDVLKPLLVMIQFVRVVQTHWIATLTLSTSLVVLSVNPVWPLLDTSILNKTPNITPDLSTVYNEFKVQSGRLKLRVEMLTILSTINVIFDLSIALNLSINGKFQLRRLGVIFYMRCWSLAFPINLGLKSITEPSSIYWTDHASPCGIG